MSITSKILAAAAFAVTVSFSATSAQAEWRGWNYFGADYPVSVGMDAFTAEVERLSDGRLTGQTYHNGVLGTGADAITQVRLGALEFSAISVGNLGELVEETNVLSLPFIFTSVDHMHRVMDGDIGDQIEAAMEEQGIVLLAWYDSGARSFYNGDHPIETPADLEGMKVRVMGNEIFVNMVNNMGGNGTPMAFGEVYQSLRTGVIDGAENNFPSYQSTNHFEVAKYYSLTEHLIIPDCLCFSRVVWDTLSVEDQALLREAGALSQQVQRDAWAEAVVASREIVEEAGSIINVIEDKAPFQELMAPVYETFVEEHPAQEALMNAILASD